jgi:cold shock CspA family protein
MDTYIGTYLGTILSWFSHRNFGFVRLDNPVEGLPLEVFVHASDAPNQVLGKDVRISFEIGRFGGKPKAVNVKTVVGYSASPSPINGKAVIS